MKFFNGVELPIDTIDINPDTGFMKLVARNDGVYIKQSDGTLSRIFQFGDPTVFIQPTQPVYPGKYVWIQTNVNGNPDDFTIWFEDGVV